MKTLQHDKNLLNQPLIMDLQRHETSLIDAFLKTCFGYFGLYLGISEPILNDNNGIRHRFFLVPEDNVGIKTDCIAQWDELPIQSDCIDVAILQHGLELNDSAHQILREVYRVIIPNGYIIITGFNPYSLFRMRRYFDRSIKSLHFYSAKQVSDWLALLDFKILEKRFFYFIPPFNQADMLKSFQFLEGWGQRFWPFNGAAYFIVAQKRLSSLTPIKVRQSFLKKVLATDAIEPSGYPRNNRHDDL